MSTVRLFVLFVFGELTRQYREHHILLETTGELWRIFSIVHFILLIAGWLFSDFNSDFGRFYLALFPFMEVPTFIWWLKYHAIPYLRDRAIEWSYFRASGGKVKSDSDQFVNDYSKNIQELEEIEDEIDSQFSSEIPEWLQK